MTSHKINRNVKVNDVIEQRDTKILITNKSSDNRTSFKVLYNTLFTLKTFITEKTAKLFVI